MINITVPQVIGGLQCQERHIDAAASDANPHVQIPT